MHFRNALNSSILACTLADKNTHNRIPKYPEKPFNPEKNEDFGGMSEDRLKAERQKAYMFFKIYADSWKRKNKNKSENS